MARPSGVLGRAAWRMCHETSAAATDTAAALASHHRKSVFPEASEELFVASNRNTEEETPADVQEIAMPT